jgi:excisionase family DNA binding protein
LISGASHNRKLLIAHTATPRKSKMIDLSPGLLRVFVLDREQISNVGVKSMSISAVRKGLLTVEQFADAVGLRPSTVRQWVWRREVEFIRIGRAIRFRPETAERLIAAGTVPARERK